MDIVPVPCILSENLTTYVMLNETFLYVLCYSRWSDYTTTHLSLVETKQTQGTSCSSFVTYVGPVSPIYREGGGGGGGGCRVWGVGCGV